MQYSGYTYAKNSLFIWNLNLTGHPVFLFSKLETNSSSDVCGVCVCVCVCVCVYKYSR
jgi:hypothetical protein